LSERNVAAGVFTGVPAIRLEHLAAEARSLDAARMMELEPSKRYTLATALLFQQTAHARNDLGNLPRRRPTALYASDGTAATGMRANNWCSGPHPGLADRRFMRV